MKIKQTKLEDDGMYYCKMTNPEGGIVHSDTVRLTVGMYYNNMYRCILYHCILHMLMNDF